MNGFHTKSEFLCVLFLKMEKVSLSQVFQEIFKMYIVTLKNTVYTLRLFTTLKYLHFDYIR